MYLNTALVTCSFTTLNYARYRMYLKGFQWVILSLLMFNQTAALDPTDISVSLDEELSGRSFTVCPYSSCVGRCFNNSHVHNAGCRCDYYCVYRGDCCLDFELVCYDQEWTFNASTSRYIILQIEL